MSHVDLMETTSLNVDWIANQELPAGILIFFR